MKFSTIREDKDHHVHVKAHDAEWFMARIRRDTAKGVIAGYRHYLKYSNGQGIYPHQADIPMVCMSCELKRTRSGVPAFVAWNGLVCLEVKQLNGAETCDGVKRAAMQQPSTWAAFVGADGASVVILVRVAPASGQIPENEEDADVLNRKAYHVLLPVYDALLGLQLARMEPDVRHAVMMPLDPAPLLNADAVPFRIDTTRTVADDRTADHLLAAPEAPKAFGAPDLESWKANARMVHQATLEVARRLEAEACSDDEWLGAYLTGMAVQLYAYDMPEAEAVMHLWNWLRFRTLEGVTEELVRTAVATAYAQERSVRRRNPEPPITNIMHTVIRRITTHYVLRRNVVMGYVEYRPNNSWVVPWRPVTDEVINTFTTDLQLAGLNVWERDVRRYVNSTYVPVYDPIEDYLNGLSNKWDGRDHIRDLARTVPTEHPDQWADWFHTWFLGMVQQWRGRRMQFGNSVVPLLISAQGMHKSTFCRRLLPPELRQWGYTDNLSLAEERPVHQAMAQMLLINLDEFNRISPKKQEGLLKNLLQLPSVKVKRPYGRHIEEVPRLASFIATTNLPDVLTDPSGSRRFIGVQVTGSIDVSRTPNYPQLYAQAVAELDAHERYWFDDEETAAIMRHNRQFQLLPSAFQFFMNYFEPAFEGQGQWITAATLLQEVKRRAGGALREVPSLNAFGRFLNQVEGLQHKRVSGGQAYYVAVKTSET